jgi:hypothetical protein
MITDHLNRLVPVTTTVAGNGNATGPSAVPAGFAVVGDGPVTDVIDLRQARDVGVGDDIYVVITVTEVFNSLTSIEFSVKASTDSTIATGDTTVATTGSILLATLAVGARFTMCIQHPVVASAGAAPVGARYLGVFADVTGTNPTTGKVLVDLVLDPQTRHIDYPTSIVIA